MPVTEFNELPGEPSVTHELPPRWKRLLRRVAKVVFGVVLFVGCAYGLLYLYARYRYPYGSSHCCILALGATLDRYADANGGVYPHGEATPEASLSLLSRKELSFAENPRSAVELLRGKTVPAEVVQARLAAGTLLDADACGWHYVEGLTRKDNPELAILWDKVGLGHNGERSGGAHEVRFIGGTRRFVPADEWPEFIARQNELMKTRSAAARTARPDLTAKIKLPDGQVVDHADEAWTLSMDSADGDDSRRVSGPSITPIHLRWYDLQNSAVQPRVLIFRLSLGKMQSQPVEVTVSPDGVRPQRIIFVMSESN